MATSKWIKTRDSKLTYKEDPKIKQDVVEFLKIATLAFENEGQDAFNTLNSIPIYTLRNYIYNLGCGRIGNENVTYNDYWYCFNIPPVYARIEQILYTGLSHKDSVNFPLDFMESIPVGADISDVWRKFVVSVLSDKQHGIVKTIARNSSDYKTVKDIAKLYKEGIVQDPTGLYNQGCNPDDIIKTHKHLKYVSPEKQKTFEEELQSCLWGLTVHIKISEWIDGTISRCYFFVNGAANVWEAFDPGSKQRHFKWMADQLLALFRNAPVRSENGQG